MNHEDTITLSAFLTAATRLETPLTHNLQYQLNVIAEQFPASIYELHDFVEQYNPLKQQYITALQTLPSEGERLKLADSYAPEVLPTELTVSWEEVKHQLGTYFKDMVLDLIERSHPEYERKMAEALTFALADMEQSPGMASEEFNDWLTKVFESPDEEL
ncbi:hypothetical protein [Trichocoleus sp. DQ-U1]|uniref:hypothetical protein n=1 Tax=Trichocoleus sp. DQ-U1 TaxID=2933926 RepID=UPI003296A91D